MSEQKDEFELVRGSGNVFQDHGDADQMRMCSK